MSTSPLIELDNGVRMPALGLGVYQSPPAETVGAVKDAIAAGYRLIDTAAVYRNEEEVGQGIARSGIDRSELFVITKLWISDYGFDEAPQHPTLLALAQKYGKTAAQVVLRWHIDHGFSAIPKSVRAARIAENFDVFDFALSAEELASIDALDTGMRGGSDPEKVDAEFFRAQGRG